MASLSKNTHKVSILTKLKAYLNLMLPWAYIIVFPYLLSSAWLGKGEIFFNIRLLTLLILGVFWANIYNIINHIYDLKADSTHDFDRPLVRGDVSIKETYIFWIISIISAFIFSLLLGFQYTIITFIPVIISILYSVEPIKLKRWSPLAHILMGLGYGVFLFIAGWILYGSISKIPVIFAILYFFVTNIITLAKDYKDVSEDKFIGIKTAPVISLKFAYFVHLTTISLPYLFIFSLIFFFKILAPKYYYFLPTILLPLLGLLFITRQKTPEQYTIGYLVMMLCGSSSIIIFSLLTLLI